MMEKKKITVPNGMRDLIFEEVTAERELEGRINGCSMSWAIARYARPPLNIMICLTRATAI